MLYGEISGLSFLLKFKCCCPKRSTIKHWFQWQNLILHHALNHLFGTSNAWFYFTEIRSWFQQKAQIIPPSMQASYGVYFVIILEKSDQAIAKLHCIHWMNAAYIFLVAVPHLRHKRLLLRWASTIPSGWTIFIMKGKQMQRLWIRNIHDPHFHTQLVNYCDIHEIYSESLGAVLMFSLSITSKYFYKEQGKRIASGVNYIENNVCTSVTNCFNAHERVILVFIFWVAKQRGK